MHSLLRKDCSALSQRRVVVSSAPPSQQLEVALAQHWQIEIEMPELGSTCCEKGRSNFIESAQTLILSSTPSAAGPFWFLGVAIWRARCFHFGTPGTILALREHPGAHLGTSGSSWRTMGAAGWARGGPEQDDRKHSPE